MTMGRAAGRTSAYEPLTASLKFPFPPSKNAFACLTWPGTSLSFFGRFRLRNIIIKLIADLRCAVCDNVNMRWGKSRRGWRKDESSKESCYQRRNNGFKLRKTERPLSPRGAQDRAARKRMLLNLMRRRFAEAMANSFSQSFQSCLGILARPRFNCFRCFS
jgi:hypothetical protein